MLEMTPSYAPFNKATINGERNVFRTMEAERTNKTDNSGIKCWYGELEENGETMPSYGRIQEMFIHEMYPGGPLRHFIKADWADIMDETTSTGLVQVRLNPNSFFNQNSCFTTLEGIVP